MGDAPENNSCSYAGGAAITSGGGYSGYNSKPAYQSEAVNGSKRGIPDVSLAGHAYQVIIGGQCSGLDGTSASTPVFGGIISQVNARRTAAGKPTVGFINPAIYASPSAFNDITVGNNKCGTCDNDGTCKCCGGYEATSGWDAVTGLGSVDFEKFEALFEQINASEQIRSERQESQADDDKAGKSTRSSRRVAAHRMGWKKSDRAHHAVLHKVVFAVKEKNMDQLEELLLDRSSPSSPNYGKWLTGDQIRQLTWNEEAVQAVTQSLLKAGAQKVRTSLGGEYVSGVASISVWERLLECEFHLHEQSGKQGIYVSADAYSVPSDLTSHVLGALRVLEVSPIEDSSKAFTIADADEVVV